MNLETSGQQALQALERMVRALKDPRGEVYLLLLKAARPISRKNLLERAGLSRWALDRAIRFLYQSGLIDRIQGRQETFYFAIP